MIVVKYVISISAFLLLMSCAQQKAESFTLNGTIKGIDTGKIRLTKYDRVNMIDLVVDSAYLDRGRFTLTGKVESPEMMYLVIDPDHWAFQVFVENSVITVNADTAGATHNDMSAYNLPSSFFINNYTVAGSVSQDNAAKYDNDPQLKAITQALSNADGKATDSLYFLLRTSRKKWIDSFITAKPSDAVGAYLLYGFYGYYQMYPLQEIKSSMEKFSEDGRSTLYYKTLANEVDKKTALLPGNTAPDFTLKKPDSSLLTLSSLRGKYVLLDFWSSKCGPCRMAIPHWKELYIKYRDKGFEMISITNDPKREDWLKALKEEKMPWLQLEDEYPVKNANSLVGALYMRFALPTYVLLDKDGKIILYNATEKEITDKLHSLFGV